MIRYACFAAGASILAEHEHEHDAGKPLSSLAAQCLQAVPKFHSLYTHTVRKRIYAFLIQNQIEETQQRNQEPLIFFAIADESLSRAKTLLFLHHLRESHESRQQNKDHLDLRHLVLFFNNSKNEETRESRGESRSPLSTSPLDLDSGGEERRENVRKVKKGRKRREAEAEAEAEESSDEWHEMEIAVVDCERDRRQLPPAAAAGKKSVEKIWRQHVRIVILLDVVICSIMLGIWLGVCRGFQCITS